MTTPLDRSATWPYVDGQPGRFSYARAEHPTQVACEEALGGLDGGHALLYPSGMGAVTTAFLTLLSPGKRLALAEGAYYGHKQLFDHLGEWGVDVVEFDQTGAPPTEADVVFLEAPANPLLSMPDFEAAAAHPATVICDATIASPLRLRPLEHGCDLVIHSATKILSGHDDIVAGVTVARDQALRDRLHLTRRLAGIVAPADTAWLVQRGLETLQVRLDAQEASARALADRLAGHDKVQLVRYPGFSFMVSFDVADAVTAIRVERSLQTIENATSLGGTKTKLESRHRWEGDRIPSGLLRLSVGLEDTESLWADLAQALVQA